MISHSSHSLLQQGTSPYIHQSKLYFSFDGPLLPQILLSAPGCIQVVLLLPSTSLSTHGVRYGAPISVSKLAIGSVRLIIISKESSAALIACVPIFEQLCKEAPLVVRESIFRPPEYGIPRIRPLSRPSCAIILCQGESRRG